MREHGATGRANGRPDGASLRTLFLSQWFDPEPGAIRGLPLARWLQAERGHRVQVVTGFPNYPGGTVYDGYRIAWRHRHVMDGVPVLRVPLYPSHDRSVAGRLLNYGTFALSAGTIGAALAGPADVAYVYHPPPTVGLPARVIGAARRVPFVYHIADMWPDSAVEAGFVRSPRLARAMESVLGAWCKYVYRHARAISVLSPGFKRLLVERGVPAEKVHVIYNWCDEALFQPRPRDARLAEALGMAGRFNVVYAGNLGVFQGVDTMVRAARLVADLPDVQVVFVGTGQEEERAKALAREIGATNVRFLSRRPMEEMPAINDLADVLLVHLRDRPVFRTTVPSKTQVSLASGRPVLMAVRGDAADVIEAAGAGLVCAPEDPEAMAATIRTFRAMERDRLEAMGAAGRDYYLRHMSLAVGGAATDALLRDVAASRGARAGR